jgi:YD repeat-containing protein
LMIGANATLPDTVNNLPYTAPSRVQAIADITYDAKGQRQSITYGNGAITRYEYDPQTYRLVRLSTKRKAAPEQLQDLNYTYDPVGNITEIRDHAQQTVYFKNAVVEPHCAYEYDALNRLVKASGRENAKAAGAPTHKSLAPDIGSFPQTDATLRNYTESYVYDSVGNIQQMRHAANTNGNWTRNYYYADDSNRLLKIWLGSDTLNAVDFHYDTHGSMQNLDNKPEDYRLHWDYRDMIHHVNLGGGGQAWYNYDSGKQRTHKHIQRIGNVTEERLYLGGMELYRRRKGGITVEEIETIHLFEGSQRTLLVDDILQTDQPDPGVATNYRYQLNNHLGSAGVVLDELAQVVSCEEYHPYGTTSYQAGVSP